MKSVFFFLLLFDDYMCVSSLRPHPAAPLHPHHEEEVEELQTEDLYRWSAWTY